MPQRNLPLNEAEGASLAASIAPAACLNEVCLLTKQRVASEVAAAIPQEPQRSLPLNEAEGSSVISPAREHSMPQRSLPLNEAEGPPRQDVRAGDHASTKSAP